MCTEQQTSDRPYTVTCTINMQIHNEKTLRLITKPCLKNATTVSYKVDDLTFAYRLFNVIKLSVTMNCITIITVYHTPRGRLFL